MTVGILSPDTWNQGRFQVRLEISDMMPQKPNGTISQCIEFMRNLVHGNVSQPLVETGMVPARSWKLENLCHEINTPPRHSPYG
jgi:hypothetical protein